jgi:hypothetical protein
MKFQFWIITAILAFFIGCSSSEQVERGNLSDAMKKSSDSYKGERTTEPAAQSQKNDDSPSLFGLFFENDSTATQKDSSAYAILQDSVKEARQKQNSSTDDNIRSFWLGVDFGSGILNDREYFGLSHFSLHLGGYTNDFGWLQYSAGFNYAPVQQTSKLSQSLSDGVFMLNVGASYRFFTTPEYTFLGHYLIIGGGLEWMFWNYKNPIQSPRTDNWGNIIGYDRISSDNIAGFDLHFGTGINIAQFPLLRLGGELTPGIIVWGFKTSEGFSNDIFFPFLYVKFKITMNLHLPD